MDEDETLAEARAALKQAACLLREKGWTQNEYARDGEGRPCDPNSPEAVCFCALGAIRRSTLDRRAMRKAIDLIKKASKHPNGIDVWNDETGRTADEVIDLLEELAG